MLYLSSAGNEAMEARMVLGSVGRLGQHSISMRKRILLACCDLGLVRAALKLQFQTRFVPELSRLKAHSNMMLISHR